MEKQDFKEILDAMLGKIKRTSIKIKCCLYLFSSLTMFFKFEKDPFEIVGKYEGPSYDWHASCLKKL